MIRAIDRNYPKFAIVYFNFKGKNVVTVITVPGSNIIIQILINEDTDSSPIFFRVMIKVIVLDFIACKVFLNFLSGVGVTQPKVT
jgi:hypothetical protein